MGLADTRPAGVRGGRTGGGPPLREGARMDQALRETGVDEPLRQRLNQSFFQTADFMRNKGG